MDIGATISLVAAIGGLIAGVAAFVRVFIDRRQGISGVELKADELDLNRLKATFEVQGSLIENYRNDNIDLRKRLELLEQWKAEQDAIIAKLQRDLRIRTHREEVLVSYLAAKEVPLPTLPPLEDN